MPHDLSAPPLVVKKPASLRNRANLTRMIARALGTMALVLASSSCAVKRAKELASSKLGCPADQVTLTASPDRNTPGKASGCGKEDQVISHCITASGSGGSASSCKALWFSEAVNQAAFTTRCAKDKIVTQWMAPNLAIDACGQRMTFVATLSGWVLNTTSEADGAASSSDSDAEAPD